MAKQMEKLSWMLEYMEDEQLSGAVTGCQGVVYIQSAEKAWTFTHGQR